MDTNDSLEAIYNRKPPSDVVNYQSRPSAPLIIPIIFFSVLAIAVILSIIKLIISLWNRKRKSDTYVFVEGMDEESKLHYTIDNHSDGKLIPLTYITVKKRASNGNINELYDNNDHNDRNGSNVRVEANVHLPQHNQEEDDVRDDIPLNPNTNSTIATESDV